MRGWQRNPDESQAEKKVHRMSFYIKPPNAAWLKAEHLRSGHRTSELVNIALEKWQFEDRLFNELDKIVRKAVREECHGTTREEA